MNWSPVHFKRHRGKTIPQILLRDPDYFFYMYESGRFVGSGALEYEAALAYRRARSIRIPPHLGDDIVVEYTASKITPFSVDEKLATVEVVHRSQPPPPYVYSFREDHFDLRAAREIKSYDKSGGRLLVARIKHYVFGDAHLRMTRKRCEEFFDNPDNFTCDPPKPPLGMPTQFGPPNVPPIR